ncbi:General substrate transporter [Akanthomyces lecanii RCEF 1005]|uniref:General substrate transporter n=1 Tax=Akanthomyces lecanii RCEF 1005 TaxID=1081108 RepID=A0A162KL72_CORDF|nr:General substrate transporter [Akanthomyces lecanii RCEF 1005]
MSIKAIWARTKLGSYGSAFREAPREILFNKMLLLTCLLFACGAVPLTWDQGSSAVIATLPSFQKHFNISSGTDASKIQYYVSLVGLGDCIGAAGSFWLNDRLGRLWSYRLYIGIWMLGNILQIVAPNIAALYAARIICGTGIGGLIVIGPIALVEIAPAEIRGILTSWFTVMMGLAHGVSTFCVYGVYLDKRLHGTRMQYQVVWIAPIVFMGLCIVASFFLCESPRWLFLMDRQEEATEILVRIRGLPLDHPRVQHELQEIKEHIHQERVFYAGGKKTASFRSILKETFTVPANLRRVQQCLILYSLPQLSGASSISSYLIPILKIVGVAKGTERNLFLSAMYTMSKFFFALIASFLFVDALGRRKSLFVGCTCQMLADLYVGIYVKYSQEGPVSTAASQGAIAAIFIQAFGYSVGLLTLPFVISGELWPNRIRSFGNALAQFIHRLFIYVIAFAMPSLLKNTDNWGSFIFFAGWCGIALLYVYLVVPEIAGLSVEEMDVVFTGPWLAARHYRKPNVPREVEDSEDDQSVSRSSSGKPTQAQSEVVSTTVKQV